MKTKTILLLAALLIALPPWGYFGATVKEDTVAYNTLTHSTETVYRFTPVSVYDVSTHNGVDICLSGWYSVHNDEPIVYHYDWIRCDALKWTEGSPLP